MCCLFSKDKKYQIVWDIAELKKDMSNMNFEIVYKNVLRLSEQDGGICTNPEYAMETNLENPCIIIKLNEDIEVFLDGNHRLYKARKLNVENIPCYVLPTEYHKRFIVNFDSDIYETISAEYSA